VITALPPSLGTPTTGPWVVLAVEHHAAAPPARPLVAVRFGPAGLVQPLPVLDTALRVALLATARQFDTTLTVEDHPAWQAGMRISIAARGDDASAVREDRTIVRIERGVAAPSTQQRAPGDPAPRAMHVRLDQPLSYDHAAADSDVMPERAIRVRRFLGHECRLGIDPVDPARDGVASLANFSTGLALPGGLAIHLTTEATDREPRVARGDGWHFAARSDGYVDTRLFAPVEDPPASEVALAQLTVDAHGYDLVDVRPMPAALAVDDELARIAAAASMVAAILGDGPAGRIAGDIARLAGAPRVQPGLIDRLRELAQAHRTRLAAGAVRRAWLDRLARAVAAIADGCEPTRRELAAIGFAIGGLAYALSLDHAALPSPPAPPAPSKP
jgi:hypothetical protein